ncbi:MAG: hypothetical protein KA221_04855, partial [Vitreoscilla sp.]|nr:hypothetical protein [Vitreoscilla sp.]
RLQEAKHELADAATGKIIEEKKSRTVAAIEAISNLNFQRFTRSVLLAQGSFAAFLQASVDERSDMLQQITGTEIYEHISKQVHQNKRDAEDGLQLLQAALQGMEIFSPEQLAQLEQEQAEQKQQQQQQQQALNALQVQEQQLQRLSLLGAQQADFEAQLAQHQQLLQAFAPQAEQLQRAQKAAILGADFRTVHLLRQQSANVQRSLQELLDALPELQQLQQQQEAAVAQLNVDEQQFQRRYQQQQQVWQQVSALDARIASELLRRDEWQQQCNTQQTNVSQNQQRLAEHQHSLAVQQAQWQHINTALAQQNHLASASKLLPKWLQKWQQIQALRELAAEQQQHSQDVHVHVQNNLVSQQDQEQYLAFSAERLQQLQDSLQQTEQEIATALAGKNLSEYQLEQELLLGQLRLLDKIKSLEDERQHLHEGEACPLCGATEHPYITEHNAIPELSATEQRLHELKLLLAEVAELQSRLQQRRFNHTTMQHQRESRQQELERLQKEAVQLQSDADRAEQKWQHTHSQWQALMQPLQQAWEVLAYATGDDAEAFLNQLDGQVATWNEQQQQQQRLQAACVLLEKDIEHTQTQWQHAEQVMQQFAQNLAMQQQHLQASVDERQQLFGEVDIAHDQQHWQQQLQQCQLLLSTAQNTLQQAHAAHQQMQARYDEQLQMQHQLQTQLQGQEDTWQSLLKSHGFAGEHIWLTQQLPQQVCQELEHEQHLLSQQEAELRQAIKHTQSQLDEMQGDTAYSDKAKWENQQAIVDLQAALNHTTQHIGALKQQWQQQQQTLSKLAEQQEFILAQQQECSRWRALHELIGSSDGKKYRLFAQSLTFNQLVQQANRQLQNMSDRYLLKQTDDAPLQLDVIDQYQGGTVRSAKNLSGGESFIVSLALALGLARMSSKTTRIDSLFLDEGFGTLDEDALDVALNALASLQQEGKLIGVISHVAALKERISTQIKVEPKHNGHSILHGSGIGHASQ